MSVKHIKGLDTVRAIAAFAVLISHVELFKEKMGFLKSDLAPDGHTGVILFFALSGFLITLLLLIEKDNSNTVNMKNFYLRRIFRVWPLYFFIILISMVLTGYRPDFLTAILCLTIFPNVAHAMVMGWGPSPQIWSIGVEEQFYIVLPMLVKKVNVKLIGYVLFGIFLFVSILPHGLLFVTNRFYPDPDLMTFINKFFYGSKYNVMAFGGFSAYLFLYKKDLIIKLFKNYFVLAAAFIIPFSLWFYGLSFKYLTDEFYGVLFSILIVAIAVNQNSIKKEFFITKFLGKISYGIYMYHWIILSLLMKYEIISFESMALNNLTLYGITILGTILVAYLSYQYIEKPFLRLKSRYS
jgi:peptidoglycan/LPS O-acetylase OafA/YrhL